MNCTCVLTIDGKRRTYKMCLHDAVSSGDIKAVRELWADSPANADLIDARGNVPIAIAICLGHVRIVRFLAARRGATFPQNILTLIEVVTRAGDVDMLRLLVKCRIYISISVYETLLGIAARHGHVDAIRLLAEKVDCVPDNSYWSRESARSVYYELPKIAATYNRVEVLRFLVTHKDWHPDTKECAGLLDTAVQSNSVKIVRFLVDEFHADLMIRCMPKWYNDSALHTATRRCYKDLVRYCVEEARFSASVCNGAGETPLDAMMTLDADWSCDLLEIARYLVAAGGKWNHARVRSFVDNRHIQSPVLAFLDTDARAFQFKVAATAFLRAVNSALVLTRDAYLVSLIARELWPTATLIGRNLPSAIDECVANRIVCYASERSRTHDESVFLDTICE